MERDARVLSRGDRTLLSISNEKGEKQVFSILPFVENKHTSKATSKLRLHTLIVPVVRAQILHVSPAVKRNGVDVVAI